MKMKEGISLSIMALFLLSMVSLLPASTKATSDSQFVNAIDITHAQISICAATETQGDFACANPLLNESQTSSSSSPSFDEQLGLTFAQNFTNITYDILAGTQADQHGNGPAYLINGLTDAGYWYQAGLTYNWPGISGFKFAYEVFAPNGTSIFPLGGGGGISSFNGTISTGDWIALSLSFGSGNVTMSASDLSNGAYASATYSAENASPYFKGLPNWFTQSPGFFSGLMTEWYHTQPYSGNETQATYYSSTNLTSAWLWMDEFEPGSNWNGNWSAHGSVQYSNPNQVWQLSSHNVSDYSSQNVLYTGTYSECALKTVTTGYFYVPNATYVNTTSLRVETLFSNANITGDQFGAGSPYTAINDYPDWQVNMKDVGMVSQAIWSFEGQTNWNYMADLTGYYGVPDRYVDMHDLGLVAHNVGKSGSYTSDLTGVQVLFNTGVNESPNDVGFVDVPPGATSFNVTQNGIGSGAMVIFCAP